MIFFNISCSQEGGGVIVVEEPKFEAVPVFQGPFGGPVDNDIPIPDPSIFLLPYSSFELQSLINEAEPGSTIELDRDATITFTVIIDKPIKIKTKSSLNRRAKILARNTNTPFYVDTNDVVFENLNFELINASSFIKSPFTGTLPSSSNISISFSEFVLRGFSSLSIEMNGVSISNSNILGLSQSPLRTIALAQFFGTNITLLGNNFIDLYDNYGAGVLLRGVEGGLIKENIVRGFYSPQVGAISGISTKNIVIQSNILYDANMGKANFDIVIDENSEPEDIGSVALSFGLSQDINDFGLANKFSAEIFLLDDLDTNDSFNLNLSPGLTINPFDAEDLFNFLPTEDFTPICLLGTNPMISTTPVSTWSSYNTIGGQTLYYSGPRIPACL